MKNYYWMAEVEAVEREMARKGHMNFVGNKASAKIYHAAAALRVAGLEDNAKDFECNCCGETFKIGYGESSSPTAVVRDDVPVVCCGDCAHNFENI